MDIIHLIVRRHPVVGSSVDLFLFSAKMLKSIIVLVGMLVLSTDAQRRPTYAGTGNRYPAVLPQYLNEQKQSTESSPLANRIDESDAVSSVESTTFKNTDEQNQIEWVKSWDQEKQPFWYLNWQHIQEHIGASRPASSTTDLGNQ